ncbi:tyrosine-protein kinase CSK-like isoform X1 [Mercenaria mercenaria]|uniref:tyrosine-protein kinase CSK-like isoform X1 n=1 Tax=Mercenaria mercenaria TaxID=6596 RepID=UPI001E1DD128|nr:tyrosine-protein kinase CSK-like isoform X1 [Mercenaria mercenaria]
MPMAETWQPGQEVVAVYDFRGTTREDLPFCKGDVLQVVKTTRDVNWYKAKNNNGEEGMIPATYVQKRKEVSLHAMPWHHGPISRQEAEDLLQGGEDGVFLIRDSVHFHGDFTLSVCCDSRVDHYRILTRGNQLEVDGGECTFDSLMSLVEHYTKDADGLCTKLITPLPKQGGNFFSVSPEEFALGGWTIKLDDLVIGELIGKGEFGDVHKGLYKGKAVAIKKLKDDNRAAQSFLREASLMTSVRHPNLVSLIGIVQEGTIYLVLDFMGKGNLVEYLRSRGRSVITKKDQINFATDTCSAMAYLEDRQLVHRDLAARNVLVNDEGTAKVSDFGLANRVDYNPAQVGGKFPIKWTAPEALRDNKFTSKSDMWSFGILLWEIYSFGRVPYPRIPLADVVMHVERGYRMEAPEGCPPEIYTIMTEAWKGDPEKRPTFKIVLQKLHDLQAVTV